MTYQARNMAFIAKPLFTRFHVFIVKSYFALLCVRALLDLLHLAIYNKSDAGFIDK
jgi:hypothetical protein